MFEYVKDGEQITAVDFKVRHPNAMFSGVYPNRKLAEHFGYTPVWVVEAPTATDVTAERDRRLAEGVTVSVTGYGDIPMQGRAQDMINTLSLKDTARDLKAAGITAAIIPFRDAANVLHILTADQVIEMVNAGKTKASQIYQVAWDMKDGTGDFTDGIPEDFTDDGYWP